MPMGIVSDDEFLSELDRNKVKVIIPEVAIEDAVKPGRKPGDNNVPDSLRKIIGETSVIEGRKEALALAAMFNVSPSSVSAYAHGATSTDSYNKPKASISDYIRNRKDRLTKKALRVMSKSLDSIPEDLSSQNPRDIAAIAKDMSAIVKHLEPEQEQVKGDQNNQFVFYSPQFIKEEHYETVVANE
jgi:hypothetical protein